MTCSNADTTPRRTPSTYQSLVSTLSALAPIASGSTKTVGSWGKSAYEQLASGRRRVSEGGAGSLFSLSSSSSSKPPTAAPPAPDVDRPLIAGEEDEDEDGEMGNEHARQLSASIRHRPSSSDDAVIFSSWDTASPQTRVLIQVFASGRIEIWNATSFSELCEVLNVDFKHITTSHRNTSTASALPLTARFVSTSASTPLNGHVPLLAVL